MNKTFIKTFIKNNFNLDTSKVKKPSKLNEVVFKSYQDVITKQMKAGKDVSNLTNRLNTLLSNYKTK